MRLLALETTERIGTVAALDDAVLLREDRLNPDQQSARSLAPGIKRLLDEVDWKPADVELVAVTIGPGSFTGLRLGLATAKTFAYSVGASILGVGTLEVIAAAAPESASPLSVVIDAQRGDVVACEFLNGPDGWFLPTGPPRLMEVSAWLAGLSPKTHVSGPALRRFADRVPAHATVLPVELWSPSAAQVGRLAAHDWAAGRRDDLWSLSPVYSRRSAAEEKWEQRHTPNGTPNSQQG